MRISSIVALHALLLSSVVWARSPLDDQAPTARVAAIEAALEQSLVDTGTPGMAVAIVVDDQVVLQRGFGERDTEAGLPVDENTLFAIGSTTKAFTATLIGALMDEARMNWDTRVFSLLPSFQLSEPGATGKARIRDLLAHRTGLMRGDLAWVSGDATVDEVLAASSRAEATAPFGTRWQYNNSMYLAAGLATASAGGESWSALLQDRLLEPLGMTATTADHALASADPDMARGYERDAEGDLVPATDRDLSNIAPAGALRAPIRDMASWLRFLLGRGRLGGQRIVSTERIEETWRPEIRMASAGDPATAGLAGLEYGLGWMVGDWRGRRMIFHDGHIDGFSARVALLPDEGVGVVILCNLSRAALPMLAHDLVFAGLLEDAPDETPAATEANLERFAGRYWFDPQSEWFTVEARDGRLHLDVPGQTVYALDPPDEQGRRRFALAEMIAVSFPESMERGDGDEGPITTMVLHQAGLDFELLREDAAIPMVVDPADVAPLLGRYRDDAAGHDVTVRVHRGRLAVDVPGQMVFQLNDPNDDGWWIFRVSGALAVRFDVEDDGTVSAMRLMQRGRESTFPRVDDAPAVARDESIGELLARHRAAHGLPTDGGPVNLRLEGRINFVNQGIDGRTSVLVASIDRFRQDVDLGVFGQATTVIDGDRAISRSTMEEELILDEGRRRETRAAMPFLPVSLDADPERCVPEPPGPDIEEGLRGVRVTSPDGSATICWIDAETALLRRLETSMTLPLVGRPVPISMGLGDYRTIDGLRVPFQVVVESPLVGRQIIDVETADRAESIPDEAFTLPASTASPAGVAD